MNASATDPVRQLAAQLLAEGKVAVVIGYGRNGDASPPVPLFVCAAADAERLVLDNQCQANLTTYLPRKDVRALGKTGVVVKPCDARAVNVLLREHVIERDDVFLIGVRCAGVGDPLLDRCSACEEREPEGCDVVLGEPVEPPDAGDKGRYDAAEAIEAMSLDERREFWFAQLSKCIRCYACRQACPLCYCRRCIVEKTMPQWVETSPHLRGNIAWNVARAFHLTGRCVSCGQCERVCPMNIPLSAINQKMAKLMDEWFGFRSGHSPDEEAPFTTWAADDPEQGIL